MKSDQLLRIALLTVLAVSVLGATGCTNDFYLSESEVAAYSNYLATDAAMNQHFSTLQNKVIQLNFDSNSNPHLVSTNLLQVMRSTDMAQLESNGPIFVSLDRLNTELQAQIENWVNGRLQLYTGSNNADSHLTGIHDVSVTFASNPSFTFHPDTQSVTFNVAVNISMNCSIYVNALDSFINWLFSITGNGINGTYALNVAVNNLQLNGQASLLSPYADAGRVRLQLTPQPGAIVVTDSVFSTNSAPGQVKDGVRNLLTNNLTSSVDEVFLQKYSYFALPQISISAATSQAPAQLQVSYRPKPDSASPTVHIVAKSSSDGQLYHARRTAAGWSDYTAVPIGCNGDPTLVHSGSGQLELAGTDSSGRLQYTHWRDEAWGNVQTFSTCCGFRRLRYVGKPAVAASAPGQVEVVVRGSDYNLWFFRRLNGYWSEGGQVPIYGSTNLDPSAVIVGNKLVVIFVDTYSRLGAIVYDMETNVWGQPVVVPTQETLWNVPSVAASGDGRVDVAYLGSSGSLYYHQLNVSMGHNLFAGSAGSGIVGGIDGAASDTLLGSSISKAVLVASGYGQLELFGLFNNNAVYHNHYVNAVGPITTVNGGTINPGWQGWQSPPNDLLGAPALWTGTIDDFSATATRTGEVVLAAHNSNGLVFDNRYLSIRYIAYPRKAVGWRGYQSTGGINLVGKPAVAAVDRNFELGLVTTQNLQGPGPTVVFTRLSDSDATVFTLGNGPNVMSTPNPIDPIYLSSGPGIVDQILLGTDGAIYHQRLLNCDAGVSFCGAGGLGSSVTLPPVSGVKFGSPLSAVSYGNGQIELVAIGSDGMIYQWRYRDAAWGKATQLGGGFISAPALLHVGAGQLELYGIGSDGMARWRYSGGAWTLSTIPSPFTINAALFGPSSASSWGDGAAYVSVVSAQDGSLNYRVVGPGDESCFYSCAPRTFHSLGGKIVATPVLTAFSPSHLNVLAMGTDNTWYSNWSSLSPVQPSQQPPLQYPDLALNWGGFASIGGTGLTVPKTAQSGRRNFAAVAIDQQGTVYINRNCEGLWTGFQPVIGQTPFMKLGPPLYMPAFAAHGG